MSDSELIYKHLMNRYMITVDAFIRASAELAESKELCTELVETNQKLTRELENLKGPDAVE